MFEIMLVALAIAASVIGYVYGLEVVARLNRYLKWDLRLPEPVLLIIYTIELATPIFAVLVVIAHLAGAKL